VSRAERCGPQSASAASVKQSAPAPPATTAGLRQRNASASAPAQAPIGCVAAAPARYRAEARQFSCAAPKSASPSASAVGLPPQSKNVCGVRESSTAIAATVLAAGVRSGPWRNAVSPAQNTRYETAAAARPARASPAGESSATTAENPRG